MEDNRKYIRLDSCFPVEFSLCFSADKPVSGEYQGFTSNVSENGICLSVRNLSTKDSELILQKKVRLKLNIDLPLTVRPIEALCDVEWSKQDESDPLLRTSVIGVSFYEIKAGDRLKILNYARRMKWLPKLSAALVVIFFIGMVAASLYYIEAKRQNTLLVKELVLALDQKSNIENKLGEVKSSKDMLESKFLNSKGRIDEIKSEIAKARLNEGLSKQRFNEVKLLQNKLKILEDENASLKKSIDLARTGETALEEKLVRVRAQSGRLESANVGKMLDWIKIHQTKKTGLILSYEGDKELSDFGFTYDQALACQVFLISNEQARARAVLDFYLNTAEKSDGLFYNAYDVKTGLTCEYAIHSGPNIWIALSACQYARITKDNKYLGMAEDIAENMISYQQGSPDKSIKVSPDAEWVSTEHNLDAYALFNMLYELTNKQGYKKAAAEALSWLKEVGYNKPEGRFMRGRGDSTIATDTFSWAIAAIGPQVLSQNSMDPDGIMEFAENECRVEVDFYRPDGSTIKVVGFDFSKAQNLGRGGVISTEWTAQMIVAFKIMSDHYKGRGDSEKQRLYSAKADYYLSQLGRMVVSSPSPTGQGEGCLPYASIDNVDTGHGWRVAKGRRTGSVSATIYYIFAQRGFNPLSF